MTVADRLLLAAHKLAPSSVDTFTAEQLVVKAWQEFPESFGLRGVLDDNGLPKYPDSNRVFMEIMGSKPLRKHGLIDKVGDKRYRLTEAGRTRARNLASHKFAPEAKKSLSRDVQEELARLYDSRAARKYRAGNRDGITFYDASSFWGVTARSSAYRLESRLAHISAILEAAEGATADKADSIGYGHVAISNADIKELIQLNSEMQRNYKTELDIIRKRTDER